MGKAMYRVGVIGTGAMGQHHVRTYSEMDYVDEKRIEELTIQCISPCKYLI